MLSSTKKEAEDMDLLFFDWQQIYIYICTYAWRKLQIRQEFKIPKISLDQRKGFILPKVYNHLSFIDKIDPQLDQNIFCAIYLFHHQKTESEPQS